jgi:hypothetical protein
MHAIFVGFRLAGISAALRATVPSVSFEMIVRARGIEPYDSIGRAMLPCRLLARKGVHPLTMRRASDYQSHQHNDWSAKDIPDHEISPQIRCLANPMVSELDIWRAANLSI